MAKNAVVLPVEARSEKKSSPHLPTDRERTHGGQIQTEDQFCFLSWEHMKAYIQLFTEIVNINEYTVD